MKRICNLIKCLKRYRAWRKAKILDTAACILWNNATTDDDIETASKVFSKSHKYWDIIYREKTK